MSNAFSGDVGATQSIAVRDIEDHRNVAISLIVGSVAGTTALTFLSGVKCVSTITCPAKVTAAEGDFIVITDGSGLDWIIALDKDGSGVANVGPIFSAVPAARRAIVDISGATSAIDVAGLVVTGLNALTGFTDAIVLADVGDGTITVTREVRNPCAASVPKNAAESGAGSITVTQNTAGVASAYDVTTDIITKASHGLTTGQKIALSGTGLPTGLAATDYYAIVLSSSTISLASSAANALAGTAVDFSTQGTAGQTHTLTPAALSGASAVVQLNNSETDEGWFSVASTSTNITAATVIGWDLSTAFTSARVLVTIGAGALNGCKVYYSQIKQK